MTGLMSGKKGLVMGLANDRSLAWGIARSLAEQGAELAFTYVGEALERRVRPLANSLNSEMIISCDVASDQSIEETFRIIEDAWGSIDFVVHAIGFSDKKELAGSYLNTSRENFQLSMDISVYSFTAVSQQAARIVNEGGSFLTLTYHGANRVMPHYNVMGVAKAALESSVRYLAADLGPQNVRVNAISSGPVKTLAASGISDFRVILRWNELNSPLRRNTSLNDVGGAGLYLLSDLSSGVTGEIHYVDSGYHAVGMLAVDSIPDSAELLNSVKIRAN